MIRPRLPGLAASCLLLIPMLGCLEVHAEFGPGVDYRRFGSTFKWFSEAERDAENRRVSNTSADEFIRNSITRAVEERGYTFVDKDPDFKIDYAVMRVTRGGLANASLSRLRDEGSLIIDIVNARTGRIAWRGYASEELTYTAEPAEVRKKVSAAIEAILARFPKAGTQ